MGFRARRAARLNSMAREMEGKLQKQNPFIFEAESPGNAAEYEMFETGYEAEAEDEMRRARRFPAYAGRGSVRRRRRRPRPFPVWPWRTVLTPAAAVADPMTDEPPAGNSLASVAAADPDRPAAATTNGDGTPSPEPSDEGNEYFIGKTLRSVKRAAGSAARSAGRVAKGVGRAASTVGRIVPVQQIADAAARLAPATPIGLVTRAAYGGIAAAAQGKNVFQGAVRSLAPDPGGRFLLDTARGVARGENIWSAARRAGQAGIKDVRERLRFAEMVAPFIPGVGSGIGAALSAANALANGQSITNAMVAAVRGAMPGGALAQTAFDTAVNLARGKSLTQTALEAARARLPGGPAAKAAFDTAVALAQGKKLQDAALQATGKLLPPSPYSADALSFARRVAAGQNVQNAALSVAGQRVFQRMQQLAPRR